jgi:peptidylprolyl isomerase
MNKLLICIFTVLLLIAFIGISGAKDPFTTLPSGLEYKDLKKGSGKEAHLGATAVMHFVGWLSDGGQKGKEIFNSRKERQPVSFKIGTDKVMQGWNEGVLGMRPGGKRMVRIPPELGYGAKAVDDVVPANAPLIFIIELLEIK